MKPGSTAPDPLPGPQARPPYAWGLGGRGHPKAGPETSLCVLVLLQTRSVAQGELLSLSGPQFPIPSSEGWIGAIVPDPH